MRPAKTPGLRLSSQVYLATIAWTLALSALLVVFLVNYSRTVTDRALDRAVIVRAESAGMDLGRAIHEDWLELRYVADQMAGRDAVSARTLFDGMVGNGDRVAWVGLAGADGTVQVASGGLLEEANVAQRPWFKGGLKAPYAGDFRDAVLLNALLGGTDARPLRFIDLATPVIGENGAPKAVLASHINAAWAQRYLAESAKVRGIDLFLVTAAGEVVLSTVAPPAQPGTLQTFRATSAGRAISILETWPDGRAYRSSVIPTIGYGDLPGFGWRLVGRMPADAFAADRSDLLFVALRVLLAAVSLTLVATVIFVRVHVAPIRRMAETATAISADEDVYPEEIRSSQETAALSVALTRIQSRLRTKPTD